MSTLILPYFSLRSLEELDHFFTENQAFFSEAGRRFEAYTCKEGYALVTQETLARETFQYAGKQKVTHELLGCFVHLLQDSCVLHAVKHAQAYGGVGSLPHYLFWLACKPSDAVGIAGQGTAKTAESATLLDNAKSSPCSLHSDSASNDTNALGYFEKAVDAILASGASSKSEASNVLEAFDARTMALYSKHPPASTSLLHTIHLAVACREELLPMQARLVLNVPNNPCVNSAQLMYVLSAYAETAWHYFKRLSTDFNAKQKYRNYINDHVKDLEGHLDLIVHQVSEDQPYAISLKDLYFDEELFCTNIDHVMKRMEVAPSLVFADGKVRFPDGCGFPDVPYERLNAVEHKFTLRVCGNTYELSNASLRDKQLRKVISCNESSIDFIPPLQAIFDGSVESTESRILSLFHHDPTSLHALSQKEIADWFTEASVEALNAAWLSLLCRVQEKRPFTLPGTKEVVVAIQGIAGYLLCKPSFTDKEHLKLLNQESCDYLRSAQALLKDLQILKSTPDIEAYKQLRRDLTVLFACCEDLSRAEKAEDVRERLQDRFAVTFAVKHDIAYCPFATSFIIAKFVHMLAEIYKLLSFDSDCFIYEQYYCEAFISKGILPQFLFSSLWTVPHLIKSSCLPMGLAIISFDREVSFLERFAAPNDILFSNFYRDRYTSDTMINASWKLEQNHGRQLLLRNVSQVKAELSSALPMVAFANQTITAYDLHQLLDVLLCMLLHEDSGNIRSGLEYCIGTQTRARILPTSFPNTFLEKKRRQIIFNSHSFFAIGVDFSAIARQVQYVLPTEEQCILMFLATHILFDTILEQTRAAMPNGSLSMACFFKKFQANLSVQEHLLCMYDRNWVRLLGEGILNYTSCDISDSKSSLSLLAIPSVQQRLNLALYTWPLGNGEIFISHANLHSLTNLYEFFSDNKAFFASDDKYFEAYACSGGYVLLSKQQAQASSLYQCRKNVTHEFMGRLLELFEESPVRYAVSNVQKHGSFLLPYLFWVKFNLTNGTSALSKFNTASFSSKSPFLVVSDGAQVITSKSRQLLSLKHLPSCASLLHTVMLAVGSRQESVLMHGRLILEVPRGKVNGGQVNRGQLAYVLNHFADSAFQYFASLSTDFQKEGKMIIRGNYIYKQKTDFKSKLELVIKSVPSNQPYKISLKNMYFGEMLYSTDIHQAMMSLERSGDPLMLAEHYLFLPKLDGFDWSACKASDHMLHFGAIALSNEKLSQYAAHGFTFPCKLLDGDKLCLTLNVSGNTSLFRHTVQSIAIQGAQVKKMHFVKQNPAALIPPIEQLFVSETNSEKADNTILHFFNQHPEKLWLLNQGRFAKWFFESLVQEGCIVNGKANGTKTESAILHLFHKHPDELHLLSQKTFADWFLEAPVKDVNVALLSLLRRVQDKEPFTLPASAQLVTIVHHFTEYLLGYPEIDEAKIKPYLNEERNVFFLDWARKGLPGSFFVYVKESLEVLHQACALLPFKDTAQEATLILEKHFKVQLSDGVSNISYPAIPTAFLITRFLHALTDMYGAEDDPSRLSFCDTLICKGILPLFLLQSNVDIPHLNKATSLPVEVVGITFDLHNYHDGTDYTPARFWTHDYLFHAFFINSIIDDYWKLLQNKDRVLLMHNIEAMREQLSKMGEGSFTFVNQSIHVKQLLQVFDLLYFTLVHELYTRGKTRTKTSMLPSAFPHTFLEKSSNYFEAVNKEHSDTLILKDLFDDFTDDMKALLPLEGNSSFPYFAAYLMLDSIIEETRNAYPRGGEVPAYALFAAFEVKLQEQEQLLYLYEKNWNTLLEQGVLYPDCAAIILPADRLRVLATPYYQERLRLASMDFPLQEVQSASRSPSNNRLSFM